MHGSGCGAFASYCEMRCTGRKPLCIPPGFEPDIQLFQRPESIRQLGDSRTDIEQQRQYGEHTAEKIWQKFLAKRNTTRFDRSLKNGRSFFLSTFTSVENLAKNMFSFSIEMLHSRRGFPHRRLCPSRLRSQISSAQAMEQGLLCRRAGVLKANGKSPKAKIDEIWT